MLRYLGEGFPACLAKVPVIAVIIHLTKHFLTLETVSTFQCERCNTPDFLIALLKYILLIIESIRFKFTVILVTLLNSAVIIIHQI